MTVYTIILTDSDSPIGYFTDRSYAETMAKTLVVANRIEVCDDSPPHCCTCQCDRIHGEKPAPDNPRSRTWHNGAPIKRE